METVTSFNGFDRRYYSLRIIGAIFTLIGFMLLLLGAAHAGLWSLRPRDGIRGPTGAERKSDAAARAEYGGPERASWVGRSGSSGRSA